jgi:hypothetical protein
MVEDKSPEQSRGELAARCHEIQAGLGTTEVPDFELLLEIGMAVRLALHIRGLPTIDYKILRLVANHFLNIPSLAVKRIVLLLADVEFVRIKSEGQTIKAVLPAVPYYEDLYGTLGNYSLTVGGFNETESLSIEIVRRLARSPEKLDSLRDFLGADSKLFARAVEIGEEGDYLVRRRSRGRDILLSPTYFTENADMFADIVASKGSKNVQRVLKAVKSMQGIPLSIVESQKSIGGYPLDDKEIAILKRLAQDGAVKPPSIETTYSGESHFLFTPTPSGAALAPTKRDIYERAMAIVAAVRQGQFLPRRYAVHSPAAVIWTLRDKLKLGKATTEATQQYRKLVHLRVGRLISVGGGFSEFQIIDTEENIEALGIAYSLVTSGAAEGLEVDQAARQALQEDQEYVESIIASGKLRKRERVELNKGQQLELELILSGGTL